MDKRRGVVRSVTIICFLLVVPGLTFLATQGTAVADDAKCQDGVAKSSRNVANQTQKKNRGCVKDAVGDVTACVNAESPKAIVKRTKLTDLYATDGKCDPVPAVGVNPSGTDIADDTEAGSSNILKRVFGNPADGINSGTETDTKCHDKIAKRAGKKYDTELKAFRGCIKNAAPLANQASVNTCISTGVNDAKAQGTVQPKLDTDVLGACEGGFPIAGTEDGDCNLGSAAVFSACVGNIVDCEACLAMNNSNVGSVDCDLVDDGADNNTCTSPPPTECPLAAGRYTLTSITGGTFKFDGGFPMEFPTGATLVQEVSSATVPDCLHNVVVPFPGGFSAPAFCSLETFAFTSSIEQIGCGRGYIDSNGGGDFTLVERGDTSSPTICQLGQICSTGQDNSVQVNLTLGDGIVDTCQGGGTANFFVSVPVHTLTWLTMDTSCPDPDGQYDAGSDVLVTDNIQNLDFTTDGSNADWEDLDADGCCIRGSGPGATQSGGATPVCNPTPAGLTAHGACLDLVNMTATTGSTGTVGSAGSPLFDFTFSSTSPSTISGPTAPSGATCPAFAIPPVGGGTITRCIP